MTLSPRVTTRGQANLKALSRQVDRMRQSVARLAHALRRRLQAMNPKASRVR